MNPCGPTRMAVDNLGFIQAPQQRGKCPVSQDVVPKEPGRLIPCVLLSQIVKAHGFGSGKSQSGDIVVKSFGGWQTQQNVPFVDEVRNSRAVDGKAKFLAAPP